MGITSASSTPSTASSSACIEAGMHRIDISAPGHEPLTVDVRIEPDQTVTYHGELKKLP
jgi:hypothetical protein